MKDRKKQRKRKLEEAKAATKATVALEAESAKPTSKLVPPLSTNKNGPMKKIKTEPNSSVSTAGLSTKPSKAVKVEESQDEDDCCAKPCLKPLGEYVGMFRWHRLLYILT